MRRRLDLAASLVGRPAVVFLDEPTTGLDPSKRDDMWDVVRGLVRDGSTVLLTTQYLEEADELADDITVFDQGRVIAHGTPRRPQADRGRPAHHACAPPTPRRSRSSRRSSGEATGTRRRASRRAAPSTASTTRRRRVRGRRRAAWTAPGIAVTELSLHLPSLDEVFFRAHAQGDQRWRVFDDRVGAAHDHALRHSAVIAKRSLIGDLAHARRRSSTSTLQPVIFLLLFTYVFGGAIAGGSQHDYLQFLLPGFAGPDDRDRPAVSIGVNLNTDIEKGVFDRFRSLPIAGPSRLSARSSRTWRATSLLCVVMLGFGYLHRLPGDDQRSRRARGVPAGRRVRAVLLSGRRCSSACGRAPPAPSRGSCS